MYAPEHTNMTCVYKQIDWGLFLQPVVRQGYYPHKILFLLQVDKFNCH